MNYEIVLLVLLVGMIMWTVVQEMCEFCEKRGIPDFNGEKLEDFVYKEGSDKTHNIAMLVHMYDHRVRWRFNFVCAIMFTGLMTMVCGIKEPKTMLIMLFLSYILFSCNYDFEKHHSWGYIRNAIYTNLQ